MSDGSHTYYYDAEHHLVQVDGTEGWCQSDTGTAATACYTYDAEGRRVRRSVPGVGDTDDYLYDLSGHFITQMSSQGTWVRGEIYAAGEHIATYENDLTTPTTFFTHSDHLGTERVETVVGGTPCETTTSLPFGDGLTTSGSCDPTALRFTDKLRDYETNLDDFGARFYSSQLGRFMSADWSAVPAPVPYANLNNPQTLNLYAIVADNPVTFADLDGHCQEGETAASTCPDPPDTGSSLGEPSPDKVVEHPTGTVPTTSVAQQAQAKQQENQAQQKDKWVNPTGGKVRGCDPGGCGYYGAPRSEGLGAKHGGTDYVATPGQDVVAVHAGTITSVGYAYKNDKRLGSIDLKTDNGYRVAELYIKAASGIKAGANVAAGQVIGTAQDIRVRTGAAVTPHIHVQIFKGSERINPETLIPMP